MSWCRIVVPLSLLLAPACGPDDEEHAACIRDNSVRKGGTFETDGHNIFPCGAECSTTTVSDIVDMCTENGVRCRKRRFITREAAICIAEAEGLEAGMAPWLATMTWGFRAKRPVWAVGSTLYVDEENCLKGGPDLQVDMETGEIVDELNWYQPCDAEPDAKP